MLEETVQRRTKTVINHPSNHQYCAGYTFEADVAIDLKRMRYFCEIFFEGATNSSQCSPNPKNGSYDKNINSNMKNKIKRQSLKDVSSNNLLIIFINLIANCITKFEYHNDNKIKSAEEIKSCKCFIGKSCFKTSASH